MCSSQHYDYIIIGAGCSGLSLAVQLYQQGLLSNKRLLLLDRRTDYKQDKSWCGWHVFPHAFESCVSKKWFRWRVAYAGHDVVQTTAHTPYHYIAADNFYDFCFEQINQCNAIDLKLNTAVNSIEDSYIHCEHETFSADIIFDGRNPEQTQSLRIPFLLQCFHGWHIKADKAIFDPQQATLMDFVDDQSNGIFFMYVLPFSQTEALLEPTYFLSHQNIPDQAHFFEQMQQYLLRKYHCQQFEIIRHESGVLPMMVMPRKLKSRYMIPIGSSTGLLRPSTGYAFYAIQRYTQQLVQALKAGMPLPLNAYRKSTLLLDDVFLQVCRRQPTCMASIIVKMFNSSEPEVIARFMHDCANYREVLSIINKMPKKPFLQAATQRIASKLLCTQ